MRRSTAVAVVACASWLTSCAQHVPEGWTRDDYAAYLVLSDFLRLPDIHSEPPVPFVACVVNGIGKPTTPYGELPDPSPRLLNALIDDFASGPQKRPIRPGSACQEVSSRGVEERATGRPAMYVSVNVISREAGCGTHMVNSYHAALWGQGAFYEVDLSETPPTATRSKLCFMAE